MDKIDLDPVGVLERFVALANARSTFTESVTSWKVTSVAPSGSGR